MTIHFSLLAASLAGGGLIAVVAGAVTAMGGWTHDWLMSLGVVIAVLGIIAAVLGVGGQLFLWISAAVGH